MAVPRARRSARWISRDDRNDERPIGARGVPPAGKPIRRYATLPPRTVGRWEGDTLVVLTNGLREGTWLDRNGSPISDVAKMTERYRRVNYGRLEIDLTIDDAKAYTQPWTVTLVQQIVLDTELLDHYCSDNEKNADRLMGKE